MKALLALCITLASAQLAMAQTPPASPSSPDPDAASTPHQEQVLGDPAKAKSHQDKAMKDCVMKERKDNSSLSKEEASKRCASRLKQ